MKKRRFQKRELIDGVLSYEFFIFSFTEDTQIALHNKLKKDIGNIFNKFKTSDIKDKRMIFSASLSFNINGKLTKSTIKKCTFDNKTRIELESLLYLYDIEKGRTKRFGDF